MHTLEELEKKYDALVELYEKEVKDHQQTVATLQLERNNLESTKAKLESALEIMTDAVYISDADGNFIDFNQAFAQNPN